MAALDPSQDPISPYYLHPSDNPAKNKVGFVDGSISKPDLTSEVYKRIWVNLEERFGASSGTVLYALQQSMDHIEQGMDDISTFYTKIKRLWDQFDELDPLPTCSCTNCKSQQDSRLIVFLMKLNDGYKDFPDGLYPAGGKSEIEGFFPPPYYEWFQFNKEFTEYTNLEDCISYLCNYITTNGPFDGLLGFSQGATLSALLIGYQSQGKVLKDHPPFKFFISVSGSKFRIPSICEVAYKEPNKAKSVHFIGEKDWLKLPSEDLAAAFQDPLIIRHPQGHTVPRLDEAVSEKLLNWVKELLVQTSKAKDGVQNGEAQKKQEKTEEACEAAKEKHDFMEKREVEVVQA
uniref:Serine hydrolase domain-containing protein n=1 Tax=Chenopodium quinoa TaxID=63459 RepID=A0A803LZT4_CHEQI